MPESLKTLGFVPFEAVTESLNRALDNEFT